jgi:hypothetical protein
LEKPLGKKNPRASADVPGVKMATETIKEKQGLASMPKRSVH